MPTVSRSNIMEIISIQMWADKKIDRLEYEDPPLDLEEKEKRIRMIREEREADISAVYEKDRKERG